MKLNGARIFLEMLRLHGVKEVFGLPGETTLALYREWEKFPHIKHILTHDERSAAYMAEAYAKCTGMVGISEAPSPGGSHPVPGVLESFMGSVPTICFTSDIPYNNDKHNTLSGFDQNRLYSAVTKESLTVTRALDMPHIVRHAFKVALSDRPGAVHVRIPGDVYQEQTEIDEGELYGGIAVWPGDRTIADLGQIEAAVDLLARARKPVIICGQGALASNATEEVLALAEAFSIPVGTTMTGKGTIPENHPLSIRVIGSRGGTSYSNHFLEEADLVFFIGSNTDSAGTNAWKLPPKQNQPKVIQLDVSGQEIGRNYKIDASLLGDAKATMAYMLNLISKREIHGNATNSIDIAPAMRALDASLVPASSSDELPIHPVRFVKELERLLPEKALILVEPSVPSIYSAAYLMQKKAGRMFLSDYSTGALGYVLPAAVGAAIARPDHTVIALGGDGSFHFNCGELETYNRLGLNIKYFLFNNNVFGWIRGEIEHVYNAEPFATDFGRVDYCKVAEGFGIKSYKIDNANRISEVLGKVFSSSGPILVEMPVQSQDKLVPPIPRWIPNAKKKNLPYLY